MDYKDEETNECKCACGDWVYVGSKSYCLCEEIVALRATIAELEARVEEYRKRKEELIDSYEALLAEAQKDAK